MKTVLAAAIIGGGVLLVPSASVRAQQPPQRSVIVVVVMEHAMQGPRQSSYHGVSSGTGFFVASDGTAITSSHVVYPVRADSARYLLLAIVGKEFYGARLICASDLPYDPIKESSGITLSRDVAEIRLTSPSFSFDQLEYGNTLYASAHHGPPPGVPGVDARGRSRGRR